MCTAENPLPSWCRADGDTKVSSPEEPQGDPTVTGVKGDPSIARAHPSEAVALDIGIVEGLLVGDGCVLLSLQLLPSPKCSASA